MTDNEWKYNLMMTVIRATREKKSRYYAVHRAMPNTSLHHTANAMDDSKPRFNVLRHRVLFTNSDKTCQRI